MSMILRHQCCRIRSKRIDGSCCERCWYLREIEQEIKRLAIRARKDRSQLMTAGGTFTIFNGGFWFHDVHTHHNPPNPVFWECTTLSKARSIDGKVEIRPMMYLALSYDHRIIDGRVGRVFGGHQEALESRKNS